MVDDVSATFEQFELAPPILSAIRALGYEAPSPIQVEAIPALLAGRDVLGQAQTGTGKTAAFALPALQRVDLSRVTPQVLVMAPTRELAMQVAEAFQSYAKEIPGFRSLAIYGGQDMRTQIRGLQRGAHVIVGTPGRIMDHMRRETLRLDTLNMVVLDEADEMLNMGFVDDIEWILSHAPAGRQVALFSATMPARIRDIAHRHLREPQEIKIASKTRTVSTVTQRYWEVPARGKFDVLARLMESEPRDGVIVFVRTKNATVEVAEQLEARGYASAPLNGDMNQQLRERTVERFKEGKLDALIATDVAARGIDVERVSHVINYDMPYDAESYVHRIGRTGRAGRSGIAILFVEPRERRLLQNLERTTRQPMEHLKLPTPQQLMEMRLQRLREKILAAGQHPARREAGEFLSRWVEEGEVTLEQLSAAMLCLLGGDQLRPPAPAPVPEREYTPRETRAPRRESGDRPPRREYGQAAAGDAPRREKRVVKPVEPGMARFRLDVGREHQVTPREIVGAIANEAGIDGKQIGPISIFGEYTTVDLPAGMPADVRKHLAQVRVRQRPLRLREWRDEKPASKRPAKDRH